MSFAFNWFCQFKTNFHSKLDLQKINCCMNERWNVACSEKCFDIMFFLIAVLSVSVIPANTLILRLSLLIIKRKHICHSFSEIDICKITKGSRKAVRLWTVILHSQSRWCHTRLPGSWGDGYKQQPGCCVKSPRWTQQRGQVCLCCKAIDNCYYLILFLV